MTIDAPLIQQAAASAAGAQQYPKATLYVVATPIGNLADLTLRAIHALGLVDAVACEDTRVTAPLLRHLGLDKPLIALHEHNETQAAGAVIERLARGERVAYASDAGTPAVSDPGARLVAAVRAAGHRVLPLPGPSSVTTALSAAGDTQGQGFRFVGFLSSKAVERAAQLRELATRSETTVLFEAPHRITALAGALAEAMPARSLSLCRELTKQFEHVETLDAAALPNWLAADPHRIRGEFVLVLHALPATAGEDGPMNAGAERLLRTLVAALPLKQAVALTAEATGAPRNALYERALQLKSGAPTEDDAA
ncbi:MAG: 16S rRNA (cytidine(1402)-2'-O)-methyltransferase [Methylibium sp.]|uniref:16S rRNA (cytidine(1402)-2'-O)-methyltransferase n=1 Tax=Methylibium sp. Root1272 TaxID=1736441 RepID=UPI001F44A824|nr:16S rRNA (cytidine(1402)-2'-O)-methyltransferase [Methylibium sp. Root1272]MDP1791079.1 16S rRNA (cytidine(1402)-2'-O)-methyltransferase [Methylibium sp.]